VKPNTREKLCAKGHVPFESPPDLQTGVIYHERSDSLAGIFGSVSNAREDEFSPSSFYGPKKFHAKRLTAR
jgi:hypothetical protein